MGLLDHAALGIVHVAGAVLGSDSLLRAFQRLRGLGVGRYVRLSRSELELWGGGAAGLAALELWRSGLAVHKLLVIGLIPPPQLRLGLLVAVAGLLVEVVAGVGICFHLPGQDLHLVRDRAARLAQL